MKAKLEFVNDTITTYFERISYDWNAQEHDLMYSLGRKFVRRVRPRVKTGSLIESGKNESLWSLVSSKYESMLNIEYTGRYNEERWFEFGRNKPKSQWRDYAFFQETTEDIKAKPYDARKPWFVKDASIENKDMIISETKEKYFKILQAK